MELLIKLSPELKALLPVLILILGVLLTTAIARRKEEQRRKSIGWLLLCEIQRNFQTITEAKFEWNPNIKVITTARSLHACDLRNEIYESFKAEFSLFSERIIKELYRYYQLIRKLTDYKAEISVNVQPGYGNPTLSKNVINLTIEIRSSGDILYKLINAKILRGKAEKLGLQYNV